ncbi:MULTISPECIES: sensor histidine kinase [Winogradskyella]|uniref:sensor histidine kinase n=1 Tax=Winogradskyella TaxID=286104 RepID=UPI0015C94CA6|nr:MULTISPECIES: HAMP domain-containing sensor histidine kinase [Winogradskyella]QXP80660.1 HAMP domain-containing histidine kinase [Winogradskyella sp. HaHa_3_26]
MNKKINILISASILGLLALSLIQGYLINNTYKLKKEAFINDTRRSISRIDDFSPTLDSLSNIWQEDLLTTLTDYKVKTATKTDVINNLQRVINSINELFKQGYQKELLKNNIPYGIKYHKSVKHIILMDSISNDTIYDYKKMPKAIILGDSIPVKNELYISNTLWETDHLDTREIDGKAVNTSLYLMFHTEDVMDIDGWKTEVFKQMIGLLMLSLLIFCFVFGLLYYSIKNLITQKKIADIKTDFVNNITHELKTPLTTLSLASEMLKNPLVKKDSQHFDATINTIERQNKRLQKLIDQVLSNSLGYKEIKLIKKPVEIEAYLNTVLDDFSLIPYTKNVTLNRVFLAKNKVIKIDKFYITTALLNILENAVKYSNDDCVITFNAEIDSDLKISITDHGIGISEENHKHLFDKFYRVEDKALHDVKGLGLGLYYSNQIVKAHHGTITVKSEKDIKTTFVITLPIN